MAGDGRPAGDRDGRTALAHDRHYRARAIACAHSVIVVSWPVQTCHIPHPSIPPPNSSNQPPSLPAGLSARRAASPSIARAAAVQIGSRAPECARCIRGAADLTRKGKARVRVASTSSSPTSFQHAETREARGAWQNFGNESAK